MTRPIVLAGRRLAESLMEDSCTVAHPVVGGVLDPVTGQWVPSTSTAVYSGPCQVQMVTAAEQQAVFGDTTITTVRVVIAFPYDIADFEVGGVVTVGGREYRVVVMVPPPTFLMRRLVGCEAQ